MKAWTVIGGAGAGLANGMLGAGGGMLAVPTLEKSGLGVRKAHSSSLAVILPLSAVSAAMYIAKGHVTLDAALPYVPGAIIGALLGAWIIKRISPVLLRRLFGAFAIWAGIRMLTR